MKCLLIYNPNSGKGKIKKYLDCIEKKFHEFCSNYKILQSSCKSDIAKLIKENGENYDIAVVSGGDGTISEAVNSIASLRQKPKLAILPTGTVNDFAHNFKIPCNLKKAIDLIFTGNPFSCDCIKVNDRYGVYVLGGGIFTETSYNTNQKAKKMLGKFAYAVHGIKKAIKTKNLDLQFVENGNVIQTKTPLFLFVNSKYVAGFKINKNNDYGDGKASLLILKSNKEKPKFLDMIRIAKIFLKGINKTNGKFLIKKDVAKIEINAKEIINFNLDGELLQSKNLKVSIDSNLIEIIVPKNFN